MNVRFNFAIFFAFFLFFFFFTKGSSLFKAYASALKSHSVFFAVRLVLLRERDSMRFIAPLKQKPLARGEF